MAQVTFKNLTNQVLLLQELYRNILPNEEFTIERYRDDLHSMPAIRDLWYTGKLQVTVSSVAGEDPFIEMVDPHGQSGTAVPPAGSPASTITNIYAAPETFIRVNADNGPINVFLPPVATNPDASIRIKNESDSNYLVNIIGDGSDTVDNVAPLSATGRFGVQLRSNGISDWMIY